MTDLETEDVFKTWIDREDIFKACGLKDKCLSPYQVERVLLNIFDDSTLRDYLKERRIEGAELISLGSSEGITINPLSAPKNWMAYYETGYGRASTYETFFRPIFKEKGRLFYKPYERALPEERESIRNILVRRKIKVMALDIPLKIIDVAGL